jgi:DNA repair exonuclease SbcCD nuclease subunit
MKICVIGDVHWTEYGSVLRTRGSHYSTRLENLISSVGWAENIAKEKNCDSIVYLGDFFDSPTLDSESITALKDIKWSSAIPHSFIVGNHESGLATLEFNSTNALDMPNFKIIYSPCADGRCIFIPYMIDEDRKSIEEYIKSTGYDMTKGKPIVFSHNDIKGIKYGAFESKIGFSLDEIEKNCALFINGHLHNGSWLNTKKTIINLGNLSGLNFSEDATVYEHHIAILDTDTCALELIENPFALNFYKFDIGKASDLSKLTGLKQHAVISLKCEESLVQDARNALEGHCIVYRIMPYKSENDKTDEQQQSLSMTDHLKQFSDFVLANVENTTALKEELSEVLR